MSRPLDLFVPSRTLNATSDRPWRSPGGDLITTASRPKPTAPRRGMAGRLLRSAVLLVAAGVATLALFPQVRAAASAAWPAASPADVFHAKNIRLLLLGADREYRANGQRLSTTGRSDTMMLADLDLAANTVHLTSIPRDSEVEVPGHGVRKINAAYSLGGLDLSRRTVERLVGGRVDHILAIDLDAFREAVDALGGVDVTVDKDLRYTDHWANLNIDIPAGLNHLDGEHAMQFVRFRHDAMADIGRVKRQQDFMRAVGAAMKRPSSVTAWPGVARAVASHTTTDLTLAQIVALGRFARGLPEGAITTQTLPGRFHRSGWKPDKDALKRIAAGLKATPSPSVPAP